MDTHSKLPLQTTLVAFSIASIIFFIFYRRWTKKPTAPEAGGAWPVIGHLHLFGGGDASPPHITLGEMADELGPIFTVKLGVHRAIVVSSSDLAREILTTHDRVFASRPKSLSMEILGYNYSMIGFIPYGDYWRHTRKIATIELLSNHRLEKLNHVRESETSAAVREIHELWRTKSEARTGVAAMEMINWFTNTTLNVIFRMIVGKRFAGDTTGSEVDKDGRRAMRIFIKYIGMFVVSDAFPWLRPMDIGGHEKEMKRIAVEFDAMFDGWLKEHKNKRNNLSNGNKVDEDFMDIMLSLIEDESKQLPIHDLNNFNKAICMTLIIAGSDTSSVTLVWSLSLLLNNRDVLKKAQQELDTRVGRGRQVRESDMPNLVYLQAILKETMRLYPPAPLAVPHESTEDCTVRGYHVPAGSRLILNLSKMHRDPRNWPDPCEFRPERFMDERGQNMDVRGRNFEYIPFSSGRRKCPGISFALQVMQLTLAKLLHGFEIETPFGAQVDMGESSGLTNLKSTPLDVLLSPRLPSVLYV